MPGKVRAEPPATAMSDWYEMSEEAASATADRADEHAELTASDGPIRSRAYETRVEM